MLRKINNIINILMGSFVGVTIGHGIYQYLDYKKHPDLYAMQSAPWYASVLPHCGFTAIVLLVCIIIKIVVKRKNANR